MEAAQPAYEEGSPLSARQGRARGVVLTISELHKDYRVFTSEAGIQELTEIFALYLTDYKGVTVQVDTTKIDPASVIASRHGDALAAISVDGTAFSRVANKEASP